MKDGLDELGGLEIDDDVETVELAQAHLEGYLENLLQDTGEEVSGAYMLGWSDYEVSPHALHFDNWFSIPTVDATDLDAA